MKTGNLNGRFWLNDTDEELGFKYTDVAKLEREEVESYFDMVAKDYARAMVNWGYCMPEILSNAVIANGGVVPSSNLKVRKFSLPEVIQPFMHRIWMMVVG